MTKSMMALTAALLLSMSGLSTSHAQEPVRAYLLVSTADSGATDAVDASLGSLSNCKALVDSLCCGELVVHMECNDQESLTRSIVNDLSTAPGVESVTLWRILRRE